MPNQQFLWTVQRLKEDIPQESTQNELALRMHVPNECVWEFIEKVARKLDNREEQEIDRAQVVLKETIDISTQLHDELRQLQLEEKRLITDGTERVLRAANFPIVEPKQGSKDDAERIQVHCSLEQLSRQRPLITFETIMQLFISAEATRDLQAINPVHNDESCEHLLSQLAAVAFRAVRWFQIKLCLDEATSLKKNCEELSDRFLAACSENTSEAPQSTLFSVAVLVKNTATALIDNLTKERSYCSQPRRYGHVWEYDPRLLFFEFVKGFLLRKSQYDLLCEFLQSAIKDESSVREMIMGAGKTTVIAPLLSLILGAEKRKGKKRVVMQIMPKQLLVMSHQVLKSVFSSVLGKRVYTFNFSRSDASLKKPAGSKALLRKFESACNNQTIVCTTPAAIKSLLLYYLLLVSEIESSSNAVLLPLTKLGKHAEKASMLAQQLKEKSQSAEDIKKILSMWRGGIALLDEVDLVLHPLKSEVKSKHHS